MGLVVFAEKGGWNWIFGPKWLRPTWLCSIQCACWLGAHGSPPRERHWIWSADELDGQILMAHGEPLDLQSAGLPVKEKYEERLGPGDRTQVLMHTSTPCLPTELSDLFVHITKTNYNIWKNNGNWKNALKFKLPNQGVPRIIFFLPTVALAQDVFTYGHYA